MIIISEDFNLTNDNSFEILKQKVFNLSNKNEKKNLKK